ncbi:GET4 [Cordylochernes scorpioides]|uniref:GET4 n=1 Tax=Cordylochernes scorpioides TaxID=51811 RepID=A0ABY6L5D7_9ARAC|nr:GET4 [Cordylochernes scorpioides]
MYRTLYFRYLNHNKYSEVINLLYDGAIIFFDHNQHNSAADLSLLMVEALTKSNAATTEPHLEHVAQLFARLRPDAPERLAFLSAALRWSSSHPSLHQKVALVLWKEKNYSQARYHFIHSTDGNNCATMLIEYHVNRGYPNELDLFIAQAVLQYLNHNKYSEVINLLYDGAIIFFDHNQHNSAADLSLLMVEALTKSNAATTEPHLEHVAQLFARLRPDAPERLAFLSAALRWSSSHPSLHQKVALVLWKEKNYSQARYHFIHSTDGNNCATMLIEYHVNRGYPNELDLFIAQAVLQYLCLSNKSCASVVFWTYIENHPEMVNKGPPFLLPLLNFLWFLLLAVDEPRSAVFTILCQHYKPSLARDPSYTQYLSRIGQLFFGLPPTSPKCRGPGGGLFGNLLSSLCGGGLGDDFDDEPEPSTSSQQHQPEDLD